MSRKHKVAWLVGLYTIDLEIRIKDLGYRLTRVFPDLNFVGKVEEVPYLIIFSENDHADPAMMKVVRDVYRGAVMIDLPAQIPFFIMNEDPEILKQKNKHLIARLLTSVRHLPCRWEN
jgi:hypothetical protein